MGKWTRRLVFTGLLAAISSVAAGADVGDDADAMPRWSVTAGGVVVSPEGGREGYGGLVNLAWQTPYRSPGAPGSYFALELELLETTDQFRRGRGDDRIKGDLRAAGLYLAVNTHFTERAFYRVRLGGVYRYLDESDRDGRHQGRLGVSMGLGYSLTERLDLVSDAGLQYLGDNLRLFYTGSAGLRLHF